MTNEIIENLNVLIKHLEKETFSLSTKSDIILNELKHWKSEITLEELKVSIPKILFIASAKMV